MDEQVDRSLIDRKDTLITRDEKILCLAENTIRLNEYNLAKDIYDALGFYMPRPSIIRYMIQRAHKVIGLECGITEETFYKLKFSTYVDYYNKSPYSKLYEVICNLSRQKFKVDTCIMYNNFNGKVDVSSLKEDGFKRAEYSGDIAEIEDYINENDITCVIMDDISILKELIDRKNINIEHMSFMITKIGYNFIELDDGQVSTRHPELLDYMEEVNFEWMMVEPYSFTPEEFEETEHMG